VTMLGMATQIHEIAMIAGGALLNPYLLTVLMAGAMAIVTGLAGRVAIFVEDLHYDRTHRRVR